MQKARLPAVFSRNIYSLSAELCFLQEALVAAGGEDTDSGQRVGVWQPTSWHRGASASGSCRLPSVGLWAKAGAAGAIVTWTWGVAPGKAVGCPGAPRKDLSWAPSWSGLHA